MGSFLLKEEELSGDDETHKVSDIKSFIHQSATSSSGSAKLIIVSVAVALTTMTLAFILFRTPTTPQPIVVIPENNSPKEEIVTNIEKHEDKKIYNYLQKIDNAKPANYRVINDEVTVLESNKRLAREAPTTDAHESLPAVDQPQPRDATSLEKIDDIIKSLVDKQVKPAMVNEPESLTSPASEGHIAEAPTQEPETLDLSAFIEHDHGTYRVKLGTFGTHSNALSVVTKLYEDSALSEHLKNIPYYIMAVDDEVGNVSYKVLIGNFKTEQNAFQLAKTIVNLAHADPI